MNKELRRCPFCGGEAFMESWIARKGFEANVHCNSCSAMVYTITYDFEEQAEKNAIEQWNRREPMDKIVEQLEEDSSFVTKEGLKLISVVEATSIVKKGGVADET